MTARMPVAANPSTIASVCWGERVVLLQSKTVVIPASSASAAPSSVASRASSGRYRGRARPSTARK
jgi:hypothetical protein